MYHKGDLAVWKVGGKTYSRPSIDAREDNGYDEEGQPKPPCVYLPHSCDEWIIGGPEQIKAMIQDLQDALTELGGSSTQSPT